ncbi:R213A-like protein [Mya arenaria]|uniref:R213A-like protein n=1 Tax=Mya arenaria TaxID=6604 RepID=A0ABY7EMJ0_MYAAR|nr:R213A-like protein [Mya arenaria]
MSTELHELNVYQRITQAIQDVANQYKSREIFIDKCETIVKTNVKRLLKIYNVSEDDIKEILDIIKQKKMRTKEYVTIVIDFLNCCTARFPSLLGINEGLSFSQKLMERLDTGAMSLKDYKSKAFWEDYEDLSDISSDLFQVVKSDVFWIVNDENISLFVSLNERLEKQSSLEGNVAIDLIQNLKEFLGKECLQKYQNAWKRLNNTANITMKEVSEILETNCEMKEEISIFEKLYAPQTLSDDVKDALLNLSDREKLPKLVSAIDAFVKTFTIDMTGDDRITKSMDILNNFTSDVNSDISLSSVIEDLYRVTQLTECVNRKTLIIIQALGKSVRLVDFIRQIDIENVRTLYDAVDYISETNIEKETIKSLQDVVIFLNPILKKITEKISLDEILHDMQDRINTVKDEKLDSKVNDCNSNVYTLTYLYKNVANREEQTIDVISKIEQNGMFSFEIHSRCSTVTLSVYYNDTVSQNKIQRGENKMNDLRSRTLLLKNSLNENEHLLNLNSFLSKIETAFEIKNIMEAILDSGCTLDPVLVQGSALYSVKRKLSEQLLDWKTKIDHARMQYFLLTFVQGRKINILIEYLQNKNPHSKGDEDEVTTILQFIYSGFEVSYLQTAYDKTENDCDISRLGCALHKVYNDKFPTDSCNDSFEMEVEKCKKSSYFLKSNICFVRLSKNNSDVLRTITTLYMQDCGRMPLRHELITCSTWTSWEELQSLVMRCKRSSEFKHVETSLFCIANIEMLSADLQSKLIQELVTFVKHKQGRIAIICRLISLHPFVQTLSEHEVQPELLTTSQMSNSLKQHYKDIKIFTSATAGQGKTTAIVQKARSHGKSIRTLHISGQFNEKNTLMRLNELRIQSWHVLHIDIGETCNIDELDQFIFRLVVLKYASVDSTAFFLSSEIVCIEIASSHDTLFKTGFKATMMFDEIPLDADPISRLVISEETFSPIQVVSHYLKLLEDGKINNEDFTFQQIPVDGELCKNLLRKYIPDGRNLSFSQIQVFVCILADQLKRFTLSNFFKVNILKEGNDNLVRKSILETIIQMANDIAARPVQFSENASTGVNYVIANLKRIERWDQRNPFACVFNDSNEQTITVLYRSENELPYNIFNLLHHQLHQGPPKYTEMTQEQLYDVLHRILGTTSEIPDDYVLTPDNLLKMTLIMLRIWASVPVVIMGETGCGKTSLIRVLAHACRVPCRVFRLHAGIKETKILEFLIEENNECKKNPFEQRWLFIDELNTTECIGVISDLISHGMVHGELLAPNLKIVGACNPYKKRSILPSQAGGINTKLQNDPLSELEYRVVPLPQSVLQYVWDFGSLMEKDEHEYIHAMVYTLCKDSEIKVSIVDAITRSQVFIKSRKEYTSAVSLRDVNRCLKLMHWFYDLQNLLGKNKDEHQAVILALVLTYQMRFRERCIRQEYEKVIATPFSISGHEVANIIQSAQKAIVSEMEFPEGTAINSILCDNIFVLLVCIINKIPVMLVGKPGSSKSLSIQIIQNNLRGLDSKSPLFQNYPCLISVPYQGSETATSDGIEEVFKKAVSRQHSENDVIAVVILDEIGLSEVSPFNPLKVLHSRLEPYEGGKPEVAVVGLSNWALDAAKMNRAIHIYIPDMDEDELISTARELRKSFPKYSKFDQQEENDFKKLAKAYLRYTTEIVNNGNYMYGLRDFYALIKHLVRNQALKGENKSLVMLEGFQRNFNGLPEGNIFVKMFFQEDTLPLIPITNLIRSNINDPLARHLMIISRGNISINIVENIVDNILKRRKEVIVGSCFKDDLNDEYYYRVLSRIIFCMEQGHVLILKNLDPLYGSLYDMLNQRYTTVANRKTCRVALGQYTNPFCHVADGFRCIVFVDEFALNKSDPPFLNRFEKQLLCASNILNKQQTNVHQKVANWIKALSCDNVVTSCFPCFDEESIISLVSYATSVNKDTEQSFELCRNLLLWLLLPDAFVRAHEVLKAEEQANIYLSLPIHEGLESYIQFQQSGQEATLSIELTMVFTFCNIHSSLHIPNAVNLCSFQSEKQFTEMVKLFLTETGSDLIIQCDVVSDIKLIPLARFILDRLKTEVKSQINTSKRIYFVMHCRTQKLSNTITESSDCVSGRKLSIYAINFLSGWKYVTIDTIEKPSCTIPYFLRTCLLESMETLKPIEVIIREELFWSFTRIHYSVNGRSIDDIVYLVTRIRDKGSMIYKIIADLVLSNIQKRYAQISSEWVYSVANDQLMLLSSQSFIQALEQYLISVVKKEIAKVVYCFEKFGFFSNIEKLSNTVEFASKQKLLSISSIGDETGPGCYICTAPNLNYQSAFSHFIYERLELSKSDFIKHLNSVQWKRGCIRQILQSAEVTLVSKCQTMNEFTKDIEGYEHDYFLLFVHQLNPHYGQDSIKLLKVVFNAFWNISTMKNNKEKVLFLHYTGWIFYHEWSTIIEMFDAFRQFNQDEAVGLIDHLKKKQKKGESPESVLEDIICNRPGPYREVFSDVVDYIGKSILPTNVQSDLHRWHELVQHFVYEAESISEQSRSLPSLQLCMEIFCHRKGFESEFEVLFSNLCVQLRAQSVDSPPVLDAVMSIITSIKDSPDGTRTASIQRVVRQCIISCQMCDEHSSIHKWFIEGIKSKNLPNNELFRINAMIVHLLENNQGSILEKDMDDCNRSGTFYQILNECLTSIYNEQRFQFIILVIDIFESIILETFKDQISKELLNDVGLSLLERKIGLRYFISISYMRAIVRCISINPEVIDEVLPEVIKIVMSLRQEDIFHDLFRFTDDVMKNGSDRHVLKDTLERANYHGNQSIHFNPTTLYLLCQSEGQEKNQEILQRLTMNVHSDLDIKTDEPISNIIYFWFIMENVYCKNVDSFVSNGEKTKCKELRTILKFEELIGNTHYFMERVFGKMDFRVPQLNANTSMTYDDSIIAAFLISASALIFFEKCGIADNSILKLCLQNPLKLNFKLPIASPINMLNGQSNLNIPCYDVYTCTCQTTIVCFEDQKKTRCISCGNSEYLRKDAASCHIIGETKDKNVFQKMSLLSKEIVLFILKGLILSSLANDLVKEENLKTLFQSECTHEYIWNDICCHWGNIRSTFNLDSFDTGLLLYKLVVKSDKKQAPWIFADRNFEGLDEEVSGVFKKRHTYLERFKQKLESIRHDSTVDGHDNTFFRCVFRKMSFPKLEECVWIASLKERKFPFLKFVMDNQVLLQLPCHLVRVINWHMSVFRNTGRYQIKRDITIEKYLRILSKDDNVSSSDSTFDKLLESWAILRTCGIPFPFEELSLETKIHNSIILNGNGQIDRVFNFLIEIQNRSLAECGKLASQCKCLEFLLRDKCACLKGTSVLEIKEHELLHLNAEWTHIIEDESHSGLSEKDGRKVYYDFYSIEKALVSHLVIGKKYIIHREMPHVVFADEFYKNICTLLKDVSENIRQEPLPQEIESQFRTKCEQDVCLASEILSHIGLACALLKTTKDDPISSFQDFTCRQNVLKHFPDSCFPDTSMTLKLCHSVALHELMEEVYVDSKLLTLVVDKKLFEGFLNKYLKQFRVEELEFLQKALKRFVYRKGDTDALDDQRVINLLSEPCFWSSQTMINGVVRFKDRELKLTELIHNDLRVKDIASMIGSIQGCLKEKQEKRKIPVVVSKSETRDPKVFVPRRKAKTSYVCVTRRAP